MRRSAYVSFLRSLLFPNFMNDYTNVEIRKQRRPLRFSGIDSSAPLLRRVGILLHREGGEKLELSFIKISSIKTEKYLLKNKPFKRTSPITARQINKLYYLSCLSSYSRLFKKILRITLPLNPPKQQNDSLK